MKQVFHIFRKDIIQHWVGIALVLTSLGAYTAVAPASWEPLAYRGATDTVLGYVLALVVPVGWWLLIVRVVQSESLAGDRQFWVTRPYEWKKLLVAKILFVAAFINLPLLIAGMVLLAKAGFSPISYLPGLLWMQLLMGLVVLLPAITVASITTSVQQMALVMLAILLGFIGLSYLSSRIPNSSIGKAGSMPDALQMAGLLAAIIAVVFLQYSRRKTKRSFQVLLVAALAILVITVATPYATLIGRTYPHLPAGEQAPVSFTLARPGPSPHPGSAITRPSVDLQIPLNVAGIAKDTYITVEGVSIDLIASDGSTLKGDWEPTRDLLLPDTKTMQISFTVTRKFFEKARLNPVTMRASFAFSVYRENHTVRVVTGESEFPVPNLGLCSGLGARHNMLNCRAPLRTPNVMVVRTAPDVACPAPAGEQPASFQPARALHWNITPGPAAFGISPVQPLTLWFLGLDDTDKRNLLICPGTALIFSTPERARLARTEVEISGVTLADYRMESSGGTTSWGIYQR